MPSVTFRLNHSPAASTKSHPIPPANQAASPRAPRRTAGTSRREQAEEIAHTLIKREPHNIMHVVALAEVMGKREGPVAAAAVYEFAIDRFPDFAPLRVSLAVELVKAGQVEDAKPVVKKACELDPDLRLVVLDHPGLEEIWRFP